MNEKPRDPLFGAAILKLSFVMKGKADDPGFRVVYFSTIKELGLKDSEVTAYILENKEALEAHIKGENKGD